MNTLSKPLQHGLKQGQVGELYCRRPLKIWDTTIPVTLDTDKAGARLTGLVRVRASLDKIL